MERLLPRHHAMVRHVLLGRDNKDIAEIMGMTQSSVSIIVNNPVFQAEVARRRSEFDTQHDQIALSNVSMAKSILEANSVAAAETLEELMGHNHDDKIRLSSANSILDHVYGSGAKQRAEIESSRNVVGARILDAGALRDFMVALKESRREPSPVLAGCIGDSSETRPDPQSPDLVIDVTASSSAA